MTKLFRSFLFLSAMLLAPVLWASTDAPYGFPFTDPYEATVLGTPPQYQPELPERIPEKRFRMTVFPDREVPEVFWYAERMDYSLVYQDHEAPLIFIIAGTGTSFRAQTMVEMQKAFYQAGFHVISFSSPTYLDFITVASETRVPGRITDDSRDLYRVMQLAWEQVRADIEVSEFYLTGYSLGAAQAAFVAKLDEQEKAFNFKKVLMINPPVNLYTSVEILDKMLEKIPGGLEEFAKFWRRLMDAAGRVYRKNNVTELDAQFLYHAYREADLNDDETQALIGVAFRISAANMIFTSDVVNNFGLVKPKNVRLTTTTSLTDFDIVTHRVSFIDYIDKYAYPYFKKREPDLTKQELIDSVSLESIENYLRDTDKIGLMHNADDVILAPGEIDFFRDVFGGRAKIYPIGGHLGNIAYRDNVAHMVGFFKNQGL